MTNQLKKTTRTTVIPERAAQAAVPYRPARAAYTATETKVVCRYVTRTVGGSAPSLVKNVVIDDSGKAVVKFVQIPGKPGTTTTTRVCAPETTTVFYPAQPEQKAQPGVAYRPQTVVQEFGLGWNAGARSIGGLPGNGAATFKIPSAVGIVVGFNDVDEGAGYLDIEHGLYFRRQTYQVMELGVAKTSDATFTATDTFKIERIGGRVRYFKNDALIYTSDLPSTGTVFLDASMYSGGDTIEAPALLSLADLPAGGYSTASLRPLDGFASETEWTYSRGRMLALTGAASALRSRANNTMRPITGLAVQGKYGESRASMRQLGGQATAGMLAPAYGLSAGQMMPLYGYAHGPEARYGFSSAVMVPMTGMAVEGKYGESHGMMAPMQGYASGYPKPMNAVLGGSITHYATVTLDTEPMVGVLSGSFAGAVSVSVLPTEPFVGVLGGAVTQFAVVTLATAPLRGVLGVSFGQLADVVLAVQPFTGVLGGSLGGLFGGRFALNEVFAMNITGDEPGGTTQYENYPFNSVAKIGGRYYGATDDGLFLLEGEDDAGQPIVSVFGLGQMNFGNPQVKTVTNCYLGAAAGAMRLEVDALVRGVPASYSYAARVYGSTMREMRFDLGKGMQSTYLTPTFYNDSGTPFEVDAMRFLIAESARRI